MRVKFKTGWSWFRPRLKAYLWGNVISWDQSLNTFLGGHPDETFSARTQRKAEAGQWFWKSLRWIINHLFFWQADHCREAYESELARNHGPREHQRQTGGPHETGPLPNDGPQAYCSLKTESI
jgi:hypothetical protein